MTPVGVHLVGSMPLGSSREVFETVNAILGRHVQRLPDGETGARSGWWLYQQPAFDRNPTLEVVETQNRIATIPLHRLRPGADPEQLSFGPLGYVDAARDS